LAANSEDDMKTDDDKNAITLETLEKLSPEERAKFEKRLAIQGIDLRSLKRYLRSIPDQKKKR